MKKFLSFDFSNFKGDLFGGITAGIVALPLALAFGLQSGLGAVAGLYGAIFLAFFAALSGGTSTQISGPTAPMTAVSMLIISGILAANEGDMDKALPSILMVFLLAGLIQIVFGLLKIGKYIRYMPYPVVSGFMSGIGIIIILTQILPMVGYYPKEDASYVNQFKPQAEEFILERILAEEAEEEIMVLEDFQETVRRAGDITEEQILKEATVLASNDASGVLGTLKLTGRGMQNINYIDLILGLLTIIIIYGFKRVTTAVPSTLVALLAVSLGAYFLIPEYRTIGDIPGGFPVFHLDIFSEFKFGQIRPYIFTAISLAVLGAIDSLLTSVVADNMTKTKHNPNQELVGQGIGNSIASLFGGLPGAGATIRTVVNIKSGGKTRLSGMVAGALLLVVLLSLGPLASTIPAAVLAGILVTVGVGVIDYKSIKHIKQLPINETLIVIVVLILTVFVGLIEAVAVGLIIASIMFMKIISDVVDNRTKSAPLKDFSREISWDDEDIVSQNIGNKVFIKHLDGPLFFGFASRFQTMIQALPDVEVVIIRMDKVPYIDLSGLYAMEDAILELQEQGIKVVFTDIHGQPLEMLKKFDVIPDLIDDDHCFNTFKDCIIWLEEYCQVQHRTVTPGLTEA